MGLICVVIELPQNTCPTRIEASATRRADSTCATSLQEQDERGRDAIGDEEPELRKLVYQQPGCEQRGHDQRQQADWSCDDQLQGISRHWCGTRVQSGMTVRTRTRSLHINSC